MRRRILGVAVTTAVVAMLLFALPLAIVVQRFALTREFGILETEALRATTTVGPSIDTADPVELPTKPAEIAIGVYSRQEKLVAGDGPENGGAQVGQALTGDISESQDEAHLTVTVPVSAGEDIIGAVQASTPSSTVWIPVVITWTSMIGLALLAMLVAVLVARWQAARLSKPLETLADQARKLGDGDFAVVTTESGVKELDDTGAALVATAAQLRELLERERAFSASASHQLRTPLTGLRLRLESIQADPATDIAIAAAIDSADDLERTIDELLNLSQPTIAVVNAWSASELLSALESSWGPLFASRSRSITLTPAAELSQTSAPVEAVRQILDVLLDNALTHGHGHVHVSARDADGILALDVTDEGHIPKSVWEGPQFEALTASAAPGHGIGLGLARRLAGDHGARVLLTKSDPTTFTVLCPP